MKTIGIIGAGLIGRLIALQLIRQGYQVTLFDKDKKTARNSAAYAAAGLLTPLGEALHCERNIVEMGFESMKLWPKILASLDKNTFFQQAGSLLVSHEQDQGDYQRFDRFIKGHYAEHAITNLNRDGLLALEPELGRSFKQGIFLPQEGQIGNRELLTALEFQLEKEGVDWHSETCVEEIKPDDKGCVIGIRQQDESLASSDKAVGIKQIRFFDQVIDCRGTGAKNKMLSKQSAQLTNLRAVRGEMFRLYAPDVNLSRPIRLMHPRYQLYIAPKNDGHFAIGATQIESEDLSAMTVRSAMELLSAAYSVHPGFAEANIEQHISQLRPAFDNNQPQILASKNLIQVNGLFRHGYLISPVVMSQVCELVSNLDNDKAHHIACQYSHWLPITEHAFSHKKSA